MTTVSIADKVAHVRRARQTRDHTCHWPGCTRQVKPALWGCGPHWKALPKELQRLIWTTYTPGQENTATPSRAYVAAARQVQDWILANHPADQQASLL